MSPLTGLPISRSRRSTSSASFRGDETRGNALKKAFVPRVCFQTNQS